MTTGRPRITAATKCTGCGHDLRYHILKHEASGGMKQPGCAYVDCMCKVFEIDIHKIDDSELEKWR